MSHDIAVWTRTFPPALSNYQWICVCVSGCVCECVAVNLNLYCKYMKKVQPIKWIRQKGMVFISKPSLWLFDESNWVKFQRKKKYYICICLYMCMHGPFGCMCVCVCLHFGCVYALDWERLNCGRHLLKPIGWRRTSRKEDLNQLFLLFLEHWGDTWLLDLHDCISILLRYRPVSVMIRTILQRHSLVWICYDQDCIAWALIRQELSGLMARLNWRFWGIAMSTVEAGHPNGVYSYFLNMVAYQVRKKCFNDLSNMWWFNR